jgi:hypothetical protein
MNTRFNANVYSYTEGLFKHFFRDLNGRVVGENGLKREDLMKHFFDSYKPNNYKPKKIDGRHTARLNEDKRVIKICEHINKKTEIGLKLRKSYTDMFDKEIENVVKYGSNSNHFDILIYHNDGSTRKCEEKGSLTFVKDTLLFEIPWEKSVQRFNGPGNKFTIGVKYANLWYKNVICDPEIYSIYDLQEEIPNLEQWLKNDAFQCGNPTSNFGKELKHNYQTKHPRTSMNGKKGSPYDYRLNVNKQFVKEFNQYDKDILLKEVQKILDGIMDEKECWLQTTGDGDILSFKWYDKIESPKIIDVKISWNQGADIYFNFIAEKEKYNFKTILRFGKGTGFSNIRFDIR